MGLVLDTTIGAGGIIIAEADADTIDTASFSTAANIRLVALCASNGALNTTHTVSGAGLSWSQDVSEYTNEGGASIWLAYSASALSSQTVNLTKINGATGLSMTVVALTGAEVTHGGAENTAQSADGAPECTLQTTRANSYVFSTVSDWFAIGDPTVEGALAQTKLNGHHIVTQYSAGQSRTTDLLADATSTTMGWNTGNNRDYNMCMVEIREVAAAGPSPTHIPRIGPDRRAGN